jgi:hypothetical protein
MFLLVPGRISIPYISWSEQVLLAMTLVEPVEGICMGIVMRQFLWNRLRVASTEAHMMWSRFDDPLSLHQETTEFVPTICEGQ